jgi:hypothetical protein
MKEYYDKEKEEIDKQQSSLKINKSELARPNIAPSPTYTTKAPKK